MALDLTCFTTRQPNSIAWNSSSVGWRARVTTFRSARRNSLRVALLEQKGIRTDASHSERRARSPDRAGFSISRRFFFFCSSAKASGAKSGATITSLKISAIASAHGKSSVRLTAMMPPNGACRSVANARSQASRKCAPWPTPHGFVCLRMASVGGRPKTRRSAPPPP